MKSGKEPKDQPDKDFHARMMAKLLQDKEDLLFVDGDKKTSSDLCLRL